jgi:hypothetical protein
MADDVMDRSVKIPNQTKDELRDRGAGEDAPRDFHRSNEHKSTISGFNKSSADRITKTR